MLGLTNIVEVAHSAEDLLGAIRDGRFEARRDLVDLLLATTEAIRRSIPGEANPIDPDTVACVSQALRSALTGEEPVTVPQLEAVAEAATGISVDPEPSAGLDTIRVTSRRVYDLLDVVGEAELDTRRVEQHVGRIAALAAEQGGDELRAAIRTLRELVEGARGRLAEVRDGAMGLAMVPLRRVMRALPVLVREVAAECGKDVELVVVGDDVELDKKVLDGITDALKHLVINAVDHGCETPEQRVAAGKPARAVVTVSARNAGGNVVIEVADDGDGIDEERVRQVATERGLLGEGVGLSGQPLLQLLLLPAFTTAASVTARSGRGVGLDVVHAAVEQLGGTLAIESERGVGTRFTMVLPVTLGVLRCLVARVGHERYAIPVPGIVESISLKEAGVSTIAGVPVVHRHGASLPLLDLGAALGVPGDRLPRAAVVVRNGTSAELMAWSVDRLEGELELVVKDLGTFVGRLPLVTGATIDGDGSVVCLLDLRELAERALSSRLAGGLVAGPVVAGLVVGAPVAAAPVVPAPRTSEEKPRVLVVEDSVGVRELERVILEGAGYEVVTAIDGLDGAAKLRSEPADLVLSDVEMPGMDGFALTRKIRRTRGWEQVPVIIMTSRGDESDRRAGLDAGANAYLLKSEFDSDQLVDTVRRLVGR
jgi:chemotaxis protein histidine kinase CheA